VDVSQTAALERVARVLAAQRLSANARGDSQSAGQEIDERWPEFIGDATAVLKTLREPDEAMAAIGDPGVWSRMINTALGLPADPPEAAHEPEIYQKPLG
jgi:hypothetical protein